MSDTSLSPLFFSNVFDGNIFDTDIDTSNEYIYDDTTAIIPTDQFVQLTGVKHPRDNDEDVDIYNEINDIINIDTSADTSADTSKVISQPSIEPYKYDDKIYTKIIVEKIFAEKKVILMENKKLQAEIKNLTIENKGLVMESSLVSENKIIIDANQVKIDNNKKKIIENRKLIAEKIMPVGKYAMVKARIAEKHKKCQQQINDFVKTTVDLKKQTLVIHENIENDIVEYYRICNFIFEFNIYHEKRIPIPPIIEIDRILNFPENIQSPIFIEINDIYTKLSKELEIFKRDKISDLGYILMFIDSIDEKHITPTIKSLSEELHILRDKQKCIRKISDIITLFCSKRNRLFKRDNYINAQKHYPILLQQYENLTKLSEKIKIQYNIAQKSYMDALSIDNISNTI